MVAAPALQRWTAKPFVVTPGHGRPRTYWKARNGSWQCRHVHHSQEVAEECADFLNKNEPRKVGTR